MYVLVRDHPERGDGLVSWRRAAGSLVAAKVDNACAPEAQAILQGSSWVDPIERRRAYNEQGSNCHHINPLPFADMDGILR